MKIDIGSETDRRIDVEVPYEVRPEKWPEKRARDCTVEGRLCAGYDDGIFLSAVLVR